MKFISNRNEIYDGIFIDTLIVGESENPKFLIESLGNIGINSAD